MVISPGPDTALVVRNTLLSGRRAGVATVVGIICGIAAWALAAAVGLAATLDASAIAFTALKLGGAAHLVALGLLTCAGPAIDRRRTEPAANGWPLAVLGPSAGSRQA